MLAVRGEELKVLQAVVIVNPVLVVDHLLWEQVAAKVLLHHQPVFPHVLVLPVVAAVGFRGSGLVYLGAGRVIGAVHLYVAMLRHDAATIPFWMPFTGSRPCSLALYAVLFTDLVDQLGGYARLLFRQFVGNPLLGLAINLNPTADVLHRVVNFIPSAHWWK